VVKVGADAHTNHSSTALLNVCQTVQSTNSISLDNWLDQAQSLCKLICLNNKSVLFVETNLDSILETFFISQRWHSSWVELFVCHVNYVPIVQSHVVKVVVVVVMNHVVHAVNVATVVQQHVVLVAKVVFILWMHV
jgi:hypothetical protein